MISVTVQRTCNGPAESAWQLLANFGDLSWVPGMGAVSAEGSGVGMIRRIAMGEREPAVEKLDLIDPTTMLLKYSVVSGNPMPIEGLRGSIQIRPVSASSCEIEWRAEADRASIPEAEANALLTKFYGSTLKIIDEVLQR